MPRSDVFLGKQKALTQVTLREENIDWNTEMITRSRRSDSEEGAENKVGCVCFLRKQSFYTE